MAISLLTSLGAVLGLVGWVAWRYFLAPFTPRAGTSLSDSNFGHGGQPSRARPASFEAPPAPKDIRRIDMGVRFSALRTVWFALLLAGIAVAGVFAMSGRIALEPLAALDLGRQAHIQATLRREALVPPPSLPPSVFIGTDRPGLETADRDWAKLNPDFARLALLVFARAEARGFSMALLEGYRSPERQDALADSAVNITNARAFQSKHQYGLALDAAPMKEGRLVISERDPWAMEAYRVLGEEAEKAGLVWGGRWRLKDFGHIEAPQSIAALARRH